MTRCPNVARYLGVVFLGCQLRGPILWPGCPVLSPEKDFWYDVLADITAYANVTAATYR